MDGHGRWSWLKAGGVTAVVTLAAASCGGGGGGGGGDVVIAQTDSTPPTLTLQVSESGPNAQTYAISTPGPNQDFTLQRRTGPLNLLASAKDPESGIRSLKIFVTMATSGCDASGSCSAENFPLTSSSNPTFSSSEPQKSPGDRTSSSSILADSIDLASKIPVAGNLSPGETFTVAFEISAEAKSHLGGGINVGFVHPRFTQRG
jgi:hypothetical protein